MQDGSSGGEGALGSCCMQASGTVTDGWPASIWWRMKRPVRVSLLG